NPIFFNSIDRPLPKRNYLVKVARLRFSEHPWTGYLYPPVMARARRRGLAHRLLPVLRFGLRWTKERLRKVREADRQGETTERRAGKNGQGGKCRLCRHADGARAQRTRDDAGERYRHSTLHAFQTVLSGAPISPRSSRLNQN